MKGLAFGVSEAAAPPERSQVMEANATGGTSRLRPPEDPPVERTVNAINTAILAEPAASTPSKEGAPPAFDSGYAAQFELPPHQRRLIVELASWLHAPAGGSWVAEHATGGGKTAIATMLLPTALPRSKEGTP